LDPRIECAMRYMEQNLHRRVKVNAVIFLRVIDPNHAVVEVSHYLNQTSQFAQTTLRSVHSSLNFLALNLGSLASSPVGGMHLQAAPDARRRWDAQTWSFSRCPRNSDTLSPR